MDCQLEVHEQSEMIEIGPIDHISVGQGRCVVAAGRRIAVFRLRDGRLYALDNRCPHRAGPLSDGIVGIDHGSRLAAVVCPYHSFKFALADGRGLDTELHVRSYPLEIRDGRIYVDLRQNHG